MRRCNTSSLQPRIIPCKARKRGCKLLSLHPLCICILSIGNILKNNISQSDTHNLRGLYAPNAHVVHCHFNRLGVVAVFGSSTLSQNLSCHHLPSMTGHSLFIMEKAIR